MSDILLQKSHSIAIATKILSLSFLAVVLVSISTARGIDSTSGELRVELSVAGISQISTLNGETDLVMRLAVYVTYNGDPPPGFFAITEREVPENMTDSDRVETRTLVLDNWVRSPEAKFLWTLTPEGPFVIPGRYTLGNDTRLEDWPGERLSTFMMFAVSVKTVNNTEWSRDITVNFVNSHPEDVQFYFLSSQPGEDVSLTLERWGHAEGQKLELILDHRGTEVEGMEHVSVLRDAHLYVILGVSALVAYKWMQVLPGLAPKRLSILSRIPAPIYASEGLLTVITSILLFIPLYQLAFGSFIPPWVGYFHRMITDMFRAFLSLFLVTLLLLIIDRSVKGMPTT